MKAHATGWDLELVAIDGVECLRVWWLGDHIADCYTVEQVLRAVPLAVLRDVVSGRASDDDQTE